MAHGTHKSRQTSNGRRHTAEEMASGAATVMATVEDGYDQLRKQAKRLNRQGREIVDHWSDEVSQCVQDRPMQSLFAAAGVGILVGFILGRRR